MSTGSETTACAVHWFRQDLRLADNPALATAAARGLPLFALYVLDDTTPGEWRIGAAARWWLHHSLASLTKDLAGHGVRLLLCRGRAEAVLPALAEALGARLVTWNCLVEPFARQADATIARALAARGVEVATGNAQRLWDPDAIRTGSGAPYRVFTPFWRRAREVDPGPPAPTPATLPPSPAAAVASDDLAAWRLLPCAPDWARGFADHWQPGEAGATRRLRSFVATGIGAYADSRDRPGQPGTSRLSPHLHWGEVGPRQVWQAARAAGGADGNLKFLSELAWREFAHHLLHHFPEAATRNMQPRFDRMPWRQDAAALDAWRTGATGVPIVDAGMRELWATGWMHNRVRMIVASFLAKHLLIDWREGARWFWDTLVDADLANNTMGWQWVAGTGADAAPYFRIFNPVRQGEAFDPAGVYVRRWVPELAEAPDRYLHAPWQAPDGAAAGYPPPAVDLDAGRRRALDAFATIRSGSN